MTKGQKMKKKVKEMFLPGMGRGAATETFMYSDNPSYQRYEEREKQESDKKERREKRTKEEEEMRYCQPSKQQQHQRRY